MCRTRISEARRGERGVTLASLIVILTIMMMVIAYTVPQQWSKVMQRDRDYQTIFAMKQYARAIAAFQRKNGALPVSLDQLKEAKMPRFMRGKGELIDPLTGKADWIPIPASALQGQQVDPRTGQRVPPQSVGAPQPQPQQPPQGGMPGQNQQQGQIVGPIVGVRPNKTGKAFLELNGAQNYEDWQYTTRDLELEIQGRIAALAIK